MTTRTIRDGDDDKKKPNGGSDRNPDSGDYHTGPDLQVPGETDPIPPQQL